MGSLLELIREGKTFEAIILILSRCFVVFCCLPIHELAHALVANKLGDDTARVQGRLTISPFAHLDPIGTIMIFLVGIGYAKPVPVSPRKLKKPRRDMALIALAGPVSNLIMSFIASFIYCALARFLGYETIVGAAVCNFFWFAASVNVSLAVFNLIPIPPLDGSRILTSVLPDKAYFKFMQYERYIMIGLMAVLFLGILDKPISFLSNVFMGIVSFIPRLIFGVI